jgi:hemerythrin-like metal-binding protein
MDHTFQWNDSYSVKVDAMDDQHKQLFKIIDELHTAMRSGKGKDVAGNLLRRLVDYTIQHFAAEEKLLEQKKYPGLTAHQAEHRALTHKVIAFKNDFEAGKASITPELMNFLQNWLTNHIQTVDQKYGEFMNSGTHSLAKGISAGASSKA